VRTGQEPNETRMRQFSISHSQLVVLTLGVCLGLSLHSAESWSQIYRYTNEAGETVFSDQPPADGSAQEVEVSPTNSAMPTKPAAWRNRPQSPQSPPTYQTTITAPADQTTLPPGPGNVDVSASFSPPLAGGERVALTLDGERTGDPQRHGRWQLSNLYRGEHKLIAERIGRGGEVIDRSPVVTLYVYRPKVAR